MPEEEVIGECENPVTPAQLVNDLAALGVRPGMILLVHSSLSSLGWVVGGAHAVVIALLESVGPNGTLVMPTHSSALSDPSNWSNPPVDPAWWPTIRETMPGFDPDLTPTRGLGVIPECFRKARGVFRSNHPMCSFSALGPRAESITRNHSLKHSFGEASPMTRIYDLDGQILLLGVGHDSNSSLHLSEIRANYPSKKTTLEGAPITIDGITKWTPFEELDYDPDDFEEIGRAFEEARELTRGKVGYGEALLCSQRELVDFAVSWMERERS